MPGYFKASFQIRNPTPQDFALRGLPSMSTQRWERSSSKARIRICGPVKSGREGSTATLAIIQLDHTLSPGHFQACFLAKARTNRTKSAHISGVNSDES